MIVSQLIEWLKTQDQDARVNVIHHSSGKGYYDQGGNVSVVDFIPEIHSEYTDMRGNQFAKGKPYENDRTLLLGIKD